MSPACACTAEMAFSQLYRRGPNAIEHASCKGVLNAGPHGHGKDHDHDHHHHDHRDHEHDEGSQDLDWLSAVAQPAHAQRDVLADTARTALEKLAEQVLCVAPIFLYCGNPHSTWLKYGSSPHSLRASRAWSACRAHRASYLALMSRTQPSFRRSKMTGRKSAPLLWR